MKVTFLSAVSNEPLGQVGSTKVSWVLGFGARSIFEQTKRYAELKTLFPNAEIQLCSTSGEILGESVRDNTLVVAAIEFDKTEVKSAFLNQSLVNDSYKLGVELGSALPHKDLKAVFLLADGNLINGSDLVEGLTFALPNTIHISGGLAGDGDKFEKTLVGLNCEPTEGLVGLIGLYGEAINLSYGSDGGWDNFGPERIVTKSKGNVLSEIDGKSALSLYKEYLGSYANQLPSSALHFPLSISTDNESSLVRTILKIDNTKDEMIFAGNIPEGSKVRFMKANVDRLVDAASKASAETTDNHQNAQNKLAILISCVGRKLVLGHRTEEEVEAVKENIGDQTGTIGFYSYGEISPLGDSFSCQLHNQTMTITVISEA